MGRRRKRCFRGWLCEFDFLILCFLILTEIKTLPAAAEFQTICFTSSSQSFEARTVGENRWKVSIEPLVGWWPDSMFILAAFSSCFLHCVCV